MTADWNRRAAQAMGWTPKDDIGRDNILPDFLHDRNAAHLLLEEVERRGLGDEFAIRLEEEMKLPVSFPYVLIRLVATAPTSVLCLAAVEVLEKGER